LAASVPLKREEVFMEQRRFRVCVSSDGGTTGNLMFEGDVYELKRRFPVRNFPVAISNHREKNPRGGITFYFKLFSTKDGQSWQIELDDPRFE
jgi:hypothetical protein